MAIITEAELAIFAPQVQMSGPLLTASLASIQLLLEGPMGAQRPLELTEYNEIKDVRQKMQMVQLSYWPIVDLPEPILRVRTGNVQTRFSRSVPLGDWITLENPLDYMDHTGQVNLSRAGVGGFGFGGGGLATEINAIYTSGFDFSVGTTDPDAIGIKQLVGHILDYQQNDLMALGISAYSADHEGKFTIRAPASSGSKGDSSKPNVGDTSDLVNVLLTAVHKYRPRGVI